MLCVVDRKWSGWLRVISEVLKWSGFQFGDGVVIPVRDCKFAATGIRLVLLLSLYKNEFPVSSKSESFTSILPDGPLIFPSRLSFLASFTRSFSSLGSSLSVAGVAEVNAYSTWQLL